MLLTGRSGLDLPPREFLDESCPGKRLAYRMEVEHHWWERWKVLCFDSALPTKSRYHEERGVRPGDVVLISYTDKSKIGTWKLGIVSSVEKDADGLIRTCNVRYRLLRYDLPAEDMKFYFKGLKFKAIDVPVQRLSLILPVEEQNLLPSELLKYAVNAEGLSCDGQVLEDSMDLDQMTGKTSDPYFQLRKQLLSWVFTLLCRRRLAFS